jgi:integrase
VLRAIVGDDLRAVRDRALLALGFTAALRRSELVALEVGGPAPGAREPAPHHPPLENRPGRPGAEIAIPDGRRLQPVAHLEAWLARAGLTAGPPFRRLSNDGTRLRAEPMSDRAVARVVQQRVAAAGYDPAVFAGHSLRAGFLTSAARAGASV